MSNATSWIAPHPPQLLEAEAELEVSLETLSSDALEILIGAAEEVSTRALHPLDDLLATLSKRHKDIRSKWLPIGASGSWRDAVSYLDESAREILQYCAEQLAESDLMRAIDEPFAQAGKALMSAADRLPETLDLPLYDSLLERMPARGAGGALWQARTKIARLTTRTLLGASNGYRDLRGRTRQARQPYVRIAQPTAHAREHLAREFGPLLADARAEVTSDVLRRLALVENAMDLWVDEVLGAIGEADRAAWHRADQDDGPEVDCSGLASCADTLQASLDALQKGSAVNLANLRGGSDVFLERLAETMRRSGTPLTPRPYPVDVVPSGRTRTEVEPWLDALLDRLRIGSALCGFRCRISRVEDEFVDGLDRTVLEPLRKTYARIASQLQDLEAESDGILASNRSRQKMADDLLTAFEVWRKQIEATYRDLPGLSGADAALSAPGDAAWQEIVRGCARLPDACALHEPGSLPGSGARILSLDLQSRAYAAFARPLAPRIGPSAQPMRLAVTRVWNETELVLHVVETAFATAETLLADPDQEASHHVEEPEQESGEPADVEALVDGGIQRAISGLMDGLKRLERPWSELLEASHQTLLGDWSTLFRSARSEDYLKQRWLGVQTQVARNVEAGLSRSRERWSKRSQRAQLLLRLLGSKLSALVRLGRDAVGAAPAALQEGSDAADSVSEASRRFAQLPLVYRRLFALEPLTDDALIINRQGDRQRIADLVAAWAAGQRAGVVAVVAAPGSGLTTALNAIESTVSASHPVARIRFPVRPASEAELVAHIADVLLPGQPAPGSFDELEHRMQRRDGDGKRSVLLVDDLHALLEQRQNGTDYLDRLLLTAARTDAYFFWCMAVNDLAWQYLKRTRPTFVDLAEAVELHRWDRDSIIDMIDERHRRSGLRVRYTVPKDPAPLLGQRLRRTKTDEAQQDILRSEFFDGLSRDAGQSPLRALFEWVRCLEMLDDQDLVSIQPYRALSYRFLGSLDTDQAFALRSLLIHGRLSADAFARIFRLSPSKAASQLEALLGLGLIEAVDPKHRGRFVVPDTPYRVRGLLVAPVRRMLEQRHFVY